MGRWAERGRRSKHQPELGNITTTDYERAMDLCHFALVTFLTVSDGIGLGISRFDNLTKASMNGCHFFWLLLPLFVIGHIPTACAERKGLLHEEENCAYYCAINRVEIVPEGVLIHQCPLPSRHSAIVIASLCLLSLGLFVFQIHAKLNQFSLVLKIERPLVFLKGYLL